MFLRHTFHALCAVLLIALPIALAFDVGGVLPWDWWALSVAACGLLVLAWLGESEWELPGGGRTGLRLLGNALVQWAPFLFVAALAALAAVQAVPLPGSWTQLLSPASSEAYQHWLPQAAGVPTPTSFPISILPGVTLEFACRCCALAGIALAAGLVFRNRHFAVVLMIGLAVAGIVHSLLGFYQLNHDPDYAWNYPKRIGKPFGAFVNRNNAGALINLGLAGAVGLLTLRITSSWTLWQRQRESTTVSSRTPRSRRPSRSQPGPPQQAKPPSSSPSTAAVVRHFKPGESSTSSSTPSRPSSPRRSREETHSTPYPGSARPITTGPSNIPASPNAPRLWEQFAAILLRDRLLWLASLATTVGIAAGFASGSRGALVGAAVGAAACLVAAVPARNVSRVALVGVVVVLLVVVSLDQLNVAAESLERFAEQDPLNPLAQKSDGRFSHWPDALRAAKSFAPLGAGMGAYRYAYLPYQQTSGGNWAVNADNLWVEWLLEGGVVTLSLLGLALALLIVALRRLFASQDNIDRGLATAGVFALASLGVSQAFDFGLLLSPNAVLAILLAAGIAARGSAHSSPGNEEEPDAPTLQRLTRLTRWSRIARVTRFTFPVLVICALYPATEHLRTLAASDALLRDIEFHLESGGELSTEWLIATDERLASQLATGTDPNNWKLWQQRSRLRVLDFRLHRTALLAAKTGEPLPAAFQKSTLANWRKTVDWSVLADAPNAISEAPLQRREGLPTADPEGVKIDSLKQAAEYAIAALRVAPLADEPRWQLVWLDISVTDPRRTPIVLEQLAVLRARTPESRMEIAEVAAAMGQWQIAADGWRSALELQGSRYLRQVIDAVAASNGQVRMSDVIPNGREITLQAVDLLNKRKRDELDEELRGRAEEILKLPISQWERELKERLKG